MPCLADPALYSSSAGPVPQLNSVFPSVPVLDNLRKERQKRKGLTDEPGSKNLQKVMLADQLSLAPGA